jgi:hypothetical protein
MIWLCALASLFSLASLLIKKQNKTKTISLAVSRGLILGGWVEKSQYGVGQQTDGYTTVRARGPGGWNKDSGWLWVCFANRIWVAVVSKTH